jgi:apolipoprotein N-acyltransferase
MWNALLFIAATAGFWLSTGLHPHWWAAWLAPIPLLFLARRLTDWRTAFATAFATGCIGELSQWNYLSRELTIPLPVVLMAVATPALILALATIAWRRSMEATEANAPLRASLSFALIWVTYEFASQRLSPHSTFGNLAYSQADFLPVLQVASLAGVAGVSFVVMWTAASVAARRFMPAALCVPLLLLWGFARVHRSPGGELVRVGLAGIDRFAENQEEQRQLFRDYSDLASKLSAQGAALIVLPEKIARVKDITADQLDDTFSKSGAVLVAGFERWTPEAKLNEARVYSKAGVIEAVYEKHHMLPAFESPLLVGTSRVLLPNHTGVQICKDMDFPALSREYGADGAGLMLVPAWDFRSDDWYHSRMAIVRGVESGFSIVRAAKQGLLTVSDPVGRVTFEMPTTKAGVGAVADARIWHESTLYARWGDWFGFTSVAGVLLTLLKRSKSKL